MNYYERHIGDYLKDTAHLSLLEHGVYTRLLDVYYTREGGIPVADAARLIGARTREEKQALDAVLGEFFRLEGDQHQQDRCDREIERFRESQVDAGGRRENDKERQRRARERRKVLFEQLRSHDIVPAWDTKTADLESMLSRVTNSEQSRRQSPPVTPPVTRDNTATQTPYPDTIPKEKGRAAFPPPPPAPAHTREADPDPPEANGAQPTTAGIVCRAMRKAGMSDTNPGDPRFTALLAQGATEAEFAGLATEAVAKRKGWAWVLSVLQSRREEAAQIALTPAASPPSTTVPSGLADSTTEYLRERSTPLTPEEKAKADEARKAAMNRLGRTTRSPA